jgi:hypothetical protein
MPDEPDPPRKTYGFKPRDFEAVNAPRPPGPEDSGATASSGSPTPPTADRPITVRHLARLAMSGGPLLGTNAPPNRLNDVHATLQANVIAANAAGLNQVAIDPNYRSKRERRIRRFWIMIVLVDGSLGAYAWWMGPAAAIPFVCAIAGIGFLTGRMVWDTFFLNTE